MKIVDLKGNEALQGDVCIFRIPDNIKVSFLDEISPRDGMLILAEGEATGHHHGIKVPQPTRFHDDAMARAAFKPTKAATGTAKLYQDPKAIAALLASGDILRSDLAIGILVIEGAPMMLQHQEHDGIRLPVGRYYVGRCNAPTPTSFARTAFGCG